MEEKVTEERRRRIFPENSENSEESGDEHGSDGGQSEYESVDEEELEDEEEEEEEILKVKIEDNNEEDKPLDDDEDRKNPQYIPKKGVFYEHDDRTMDEGGEGTTVEIPDDKSEKSIPASIESSKSNSKKKVWKENDSWSHDKYAMYDQSPKSQEELVMTYGYDIRNEEAAPRARRRRRYGRGPNKYTRNWEDLDAYVKPTRGSPRGGGGAGGPRGRGRGGSNIQSEVDFPHLPGQHDDPSLLNNKGNSSFSERSEDVIVEGPESADVKHLPGYYSSSDSHRTNPDRRDNRKEQKPPYQDHTSMRGGKQPDFNREFDGRVRARGRGRGAAPRRAGRGRGYQRYADTEDNRNLHMRHSPEQVGKAVENRIQDVRYDNDNYHPKQQQQNQQNMKSIVVTRAGFSDATMSNNSPVHSKRITNVTEEMKSLSVADSMDEDHQFIGKKHSDPSRRNLVPPRMQPGKSNTSGDSVPKPKRYSSQRQKGVDGVGPYQQQYFEQDEQGFIPNVYDEHQSSPPLNQQPPLHHSGTNHPQQFTPPNFPNVPQNYPQESFIEGTLPQGFPSVSQPPPHMVGPRANLVSVPNISTPPPSMGRPTMVAPLLVPNVVTSGNVPPPAVQGSPIGGTGVAAPPPFMAPENIIGFPGAPPPPLVQNAPPPQFPPFQPFTSVAEPPPQEIYSNGVMYYNTQSQAQVPRPNAVLLKRPKAAIPIVPPPEKEMTQEQYLYQEYQSTEDGEYFEQDEQYVDEGFEVGEEENSIDNANNESNTSGGDFLDNVNENESTEPKKFFGTPLEESIVDSDNNIKEYTFISNNGENYDGNSTMETVKSEDEFYEVSEVMRSSSDNLDISASVESELEVSLSFESVEKSIDTSSDLVEISIIENDKINLSDEKSVYVSIIPEEVKRDVETLKEIAKQSIEKELVKDDNIDLSEGKSDEVAPKEEQNVEISVSDVKVTETEEYTMQNVVEKEHNEALLVVQTESEKTDS